MILVSVVMFSLWGAASAQMPSIAPLPPSPVSGYVWVDSGTKLYSVTYLGQTYSAGVIVGAYVPPDMILDKKYDLYFYVTRDPTIIFSLVPTKVVIGVAICVGFGLTEAGKGVFLRLSILVLDSEFKAWTWLVYPYDPETYLISSPPQIVYNSFGDIPTRRWDGGVASSLIGSVKVSTTPPKGTSRIMLEASPKPGYAGKPVTISGVMYGSWRCISGVVIGKPVEITTGWGFRAVVTTNDRGEFSVDTTVPSTVYSPPVPYPITATFYEDQDLTGASAIITYEVIAKAPTTITISYVGNREFGGYLRRADTGAYLVYKPVKLTVTYLSGTTWRTDSFDLQTRQDGYYSLEFLLYWNQATIAFEGDDTYAPSSATITR